MGWLQQQTQQQGLHRPGQERQDQRAGQASADNVTHSIVGTRSQASLFHSLSFTVLSLVCRYLNEDFILKLPSEKKIRDLKWFSVYDLSTQVIN